MIANIATSSNVAYFHYVEGTLSKTLCAAVTDLIFQVSGLLRGTGNAEPLLSRSSAG